MLFYFIIAFLFFCYACFDVDKNLMYNNREINTTNKFLYFYVILFCILLGGLRWNTGTDWIQYYKFFMNHQSWRSFNNKSFEFLYTLLNFIVKQFSEKYTSFLFVLTFLCIFIKVKALKCYTKYTGLAFFLYFCFYFADIFAVRQSLAISILFFSVQYIINKKITPFIICVLIATGIHNSSIIFIFAYKIFWMKQNKAKVFVLIIFAFFFGLVGIRLFLIIARVLFEPLGTLGRFSRKILTYTTIYAETFQASTVSIILGILKRSIILPLFYMCDKKFKKDEKFSGFLNLFTAGNIVYLLFAKYLTVFQRLTTPYIIFEIVLIPYLLFSTKKNYLRYIYMGLILLYALFKLYYGINAYKEYYCPYYSIFNYSSREWM